MNKPLRTRLMVSLAPLLLLAVAAFSLRLGVADSSWADVWASLGPQPEGRAEVIARYRLPRLFAGALVGIHFALAGLVLQIVLRNPLADPTIFGVSGGASAAVVAAMSTAIWFAPDAAGLSNSSAYLPLSLLPPIALLGGLAATGLVFLLSWSNGLSPQRMVLNGVIVGAVLNALVMAMVLLLAEARTELAILWLAGSLYARDFSHIWPSLPWSAAGAIVLLLNLRGLAVLRLDPASARSCGVSPKLLQPLMILVATGLAASAVAIAGPVGFVGLMVPHIVRVLAPVSLLTQLWLSICLGATLVLASDTVGRLIAAPVEVPVGIVTSLIGAPLLAVLLSRSSLR